MEKMLAGLSTRRHGPVGLEPVGQQVGATRAEHEQAGGSRRFVGGTEIALKDLLAADLTTLDLVAFMVDGVHFAETCGVVALGITIYGTKVPLALVGGSTENTTVVSESIVGLRCAWPGCDRAGSSHPGRQQGVAPGSHRRLRRARHWPAAGCTMCVASASSSCSGSAQGETADARGFTTPPHHAASALEGEALVNAPVAARSPAH